MMPMETIALFLEEEVITLMNMKKVQVIEDMFYKEIMLQVQVYDWPVMRSRGGLK